MLGVNDKNKFIEAIQKLYDYEDNHEKWTPTEYAIKNNIYCSALNTIKDEAPTIFMNSNSDIQYAVFLAHRHNKETKLMVYGWREAQLTNHRGFYVGLVEFSPIAKNIIVRASVHQSRFSPYDADDIAGYLDDHRETIIKCMVAHKQIPPLTSEKGGQQ